MNALLMAQHNLKSMLIVVGFEVKPSWMQHHLLPTSIRYLISRDDKWTLKGDIMPRSLSSVSLFQ